MPRRLHDFPGGLELVRSEDPDAAEPIRRCPLPSRLRVPLLQYRGAVAEACVTAGDAIAAGDPVARMPEGRGVDVPAPASGTVAAIEQLEPAGMPGVQVPHVVIDTDRGQTDRPRFPAMDARRAEPADILARLRAAGVAGLGGAGFPTADKLAGGCRTLVLNAAECEPRVSCDDRLLRERADDVLHGARLLARVAGAGEVVLAIAQHLHAARAACERALAAHGHEDIEVVAVPSRYPAGGERQLVQMLTGAEVPHGGWPGDIGVLVHNVATAAAAWAAVHAGRAMVSRIVTVAGAGVARPGNYEVALGTSLADLVDAAGGYTADAEHLLLGGPMTGHALAHDGFPVTRGSHCVLVLAAHEVPAAGQELPCIRCGRCAEVCPARLAPQLLVASLRGGATPGTLADELDGCIECGACDLVCPSAIPLTGHFRHARSVLALDRRAAVAASEARERHSARQERLARIAGEEARRAAAGGAWLGSADAVADAIARARARRDSG